MRNQRRTGGWGGGLERDYRGPGRVVSENMAARRSGHSRALQSSSLLKQFYGQPAHGKSDHWSSLGSESEESNKREGLDCERGRNMDEYEPQLSSNSHCMIPFEQGLMSGARAHATQESGPEIQGHDTERNERKTEPVIHGKLVQEIEGELTCTICLGMFVDPKVLPCLHTYCKKCVERIAHSNSIVCPQCREKHSLPSGRVDKLLTSFTFTNLVKLLEVHKADTKNLVCENGLDTNPAVARCIDCQAYLCKSCSQTHTRMLATKQHKVFSLDEIRSKGEKCFQKPRHCPIHENETLKLYCRTCSKTICGDCIYVDHRSHQYVFIKDVQEELKQSLREKLNSMKRMAGEAKNKKEGAHKIVEEHDTKVTSIHTHIDRTFGELAELVRTCHTKVLHDLDQQAKMRKKVHTTNVEEAELAHARLTSIIMFIERLLQSSDACEISTMANYTFDQCKKLEANQMGATEESCDWMLDGVEKSKGCLQGIAIRHVIPPVHIKGHNKPKRTQHSQQEKNWVTGLGKHHQHYSFYK